MKLDVRYKFLLFIIISIVAFSAKDLVYGSLVFFIVCLFTFLLGQNEMVLKYMIVYAAMLLFIVGADYLPGLLKSMILLLVVFIRMCLPILLYSKCFIRTTTVSEMVSGLYALRFPKAFVISFTVAMRFFPTAKEEISELRAALALRGLGFTFHNLRTRPTLVFEGFISPILIRASQVAEELSAASITRGLDSPSPRTTFRSLHLTAGDSVIGLIFSALLISVPILRMLGGS